MSPEQEARKTIDQLLAVAGWSAQDAASANISASRGVAIREFPLNKGHGFADYLLNVDGLSAGVVEKNVGPALKGVERWSEKSRHGWLAETASCIA